MRGANQKSANFAESTQQLSCEKVATLDANMQWECLTVGAVISHGWRFHPGCSGASPAGSGKPDAHYFSLSVGYCPNWTGDYYVICASLIDADMSDKTENGLEPDDSLHFNAPMTLKGIAACCLEGPGPSLSWVMEVYRTPFGSMHQHTFGPFPLHSPETIVHPMFGVMACVDSESGPWEHGRSLVLALFDELRRSLIRKNR